MSADRGLQRERERERERETMCRAGIKPSAVKKKKKKKSVNETSAALRISPRFKTCFYFKNRSRRCFNILLTESSEVSRLEEALNFNIYNLNEVIMQKKKIKNP